MNFTVFLRLLTAVHISSVNGAEIVADVPRQPAHNIFTIKRKFDRSKFRLFWLKNACARGVKKELFYRCWLV